jgi:hypothetical protein
MDAQRDAVAHTAHPRLAGMLVWVGLIGAFGGGGAEVVRDGFLGNGIDWGMLNVCLTFGILLAVFGECWSHTPTSAAADASRAVARIDDGQRSVAGEG